MSNFHSWKRRLWGPDYPIENGAPYQAPDGSPMLPGGIAGGPYQGIDDNGPQTGNPVVIAFTGPATGDATVGVMIDDQTAASGGGRWVGCTASIVSGDTADQIGQKIADAFNARNWDGWEPGAVNAAGTVTFTPASAGSATGYAIYGPSEGSVSGSTVPSTRKTELPPGGTDGPNSSSHGVDYWISRSGGQGSVWYYWIDVDSTPGLDTKRLLSDFLTDANISEAYRGDVAAHAMVLGH